MRADPITQESFEPLTKEQIFASKETFADFIAQIDPLESFEITKRKIDWVPVERACRECGKLFTAYHPAMHYCEEHRSSNEETESSDGGEKKRLAPLEYYKPKVKPCVSCGQLFLSTTPAMRYCEKCSDKGGKLVDIEEGNIE